MKILQILHDRERGGIDTLAGMIEADLTRHGITIETVYLYPRQGETRLTKLACVGRMARRLLRRDYDALIAYQPTASILAGTMGRLAGCPLRVVHRTSSNTATALPIRMLDLLAGTAGLYSVNIANSRATLAEFANYPVGYRQHMQLIEHGLDAPEPVQDRAVCRQRFGLPADAPLLLNTGRLIAQKNQAVLVAALAQVPEAHLAIAGAGPDAADLRDLAAALGIADRVHLLGALAPQDVASLYGAADIFVFPSEWETFGLSAVEAGMLGLPLIVADLAVLREVLDTGGPSTVRFVAPNDQAGWARAIAETIAEPPGRDAAYAVRLKAKYSRARMIAPYLTLLQDGTKTPEPV